MKQQDGYLTQQSGAWLGHYSKWILDHKTGQRKRMQRAFKIGPASMTKTEAREKLRQRVVEEVGLTADSRVTKWYSVTHHNEEEDFVFCTESGGFWWKENFQNRVLTPLARDAGLDDRVNFQILRHTVATHAAGLGTVKDVQSIMRHRNAAITQDHYIQAIGETVRTTVERLADALHEVGWPRPAPGACPVRL